MRNVRAFVVVITTNENKDMAHLEDEATPNLSSKLLSHVAGPAGRRHL